MADDAKLQKVKRERKVREPKVKTARLRKNGPKLAEPVKYSARPETESLVLYDLGECLTRILHYTSDTASRCIVRLYMTGDRRMHAALLAFNTQMTFSTCGGARKCSSSACRCIRIGDYAKGTSRLTSITVKTSNDLNVGAFHSGAMRWKKDYLTSLPTSLTALSLGDDKNVIRLVVGDIQHLRSLSNLTYLKCPVYYEGEKLPLVADFSALSKLKVLNVMENYKRGNGKVGATVYSQESSVDIIPPPCLQVLACRQVMTDSDLTRLPPTITVIKCGEWKVAKQMTSSHLPNLTQLHTNRVDALELPSSVGILCVTGRAHVDNVPSTVFDFWCHNRVVSTANGIVNLNDPELSQYTTFTPQRVLQSPYATSISLLNIMYRGKAEDLPLCIKALPNLTDLRLDFNEATSFPKFIPCNPSVKYLSLRYCVSDTVMPSLVVEKPADIASLAHLYVFSTHAADVYTLEGFGRHWPQLCVQLSTILFVGQRTSRREMPNFIMDGIGFYCLQNERDETWFTTWLKSFVNKDGERTTTRHVQEYSGPRRLCDSRNDQPRPWRMPIH